MPPPSSSTCPGARPEPRGASICETRPCARQHHVSIARTQRELCTKRTTRAARVRFPPSARRERNANFARSERPGPRAFAFRRARVTTRHPCSPLCLLELQLALLQTAERILREPVERVQSRARRHGYATPRSTRARVRLARTRHRLLPPICGQKRFVIQRNSFSETANSGGGKGLPGKHRYPRGGRKAKEHVAHNRARSRRTLARSRFGNRLLYTYMTNYTNTTRAPMRWFVPRHSARTHTRSALML